MSKAEVNIDQLVDYKSEYWVYVKRPHISGRNLTGLCPFHNDRNNSFSVDLDTGKWHCLAEDCGGNFVSFYARIHSIDTKEAYKEILDKYGVGQEDDRKASRSYTLQEYAFEKRLPEDWLKTECCLETAKERDGTSYLKEPYFSEDGKEMTFRKRYAHKELKWKYGSSGKIGLYGEWKLPQARQAGYAVLVEGESDSQSLWYMGISALGVPGASMFKPSQADLLQDLKVYLHVEPDKGGETFYRKTIDGLREGGFIGHAYRFSCSDISGCKDPSDVFIKFGKDKAAAKIMKLISHAEEIDLSEPAIPQEDLTGAPLILRQPDGWVFSDRGISSVGKNGAMRTVCGMPIILTKRLRRIDTGEEKIEIAYKRDGIWNKAIYPRSTVFIASNCAKALADCGCMVTSENAKQIVRFLAALEAANIDIIPKADAVSTFGWQQDRRFLPGNDGGIVLDIDPAQQNMAAAYLKEGTLDGWIETMRPHRDRDKFRFILAAAFAAPLLRIVKQRIFFVYNWGGSKGGKTAALKASLSAWGDPERLMVNFNATQVGLEKTAAFYCDLPLGIDERQLAGRNQESLEKLIYMISSGTGKIRGAKSGGLQPTQIWRTIALATGEEPVSTETSQTGVSTRVLEVYGGPFDDERSASKMHQDAPRNCGWAGPAFVQRLVRIDEDSIREKYDEMRAFVEGVSNGRSGSHVDGVSAVAFADAMIDTWFFGDAPADPEDGDLKIEERSWEGAKKMAERILLDQMNTETGDVNENAVQFVVDWVASNRAFFGEKTVGTCYGMFSESGNIAYIFPSMLNQALTKAGYSARKTLRYMAEQGLITTTERNDHKGQSYQVAKRFDGRLCKFVEFFVGKLAEKDDDLEYNDAFVDKNDTSVDKNDTEPKQMEFDEHGFVPLGDGSDLPFD